MGVAPPYGSLVIEHFARPRNQGGWPAAAEVIVGSAGSVARGAHFMLSARIGAGVIQAARFQAYGCPHCIASGSWLSERLSGCSLQNLTQWSWREVAEVLQVPAEKHGRLLILEDAVRALAADWAHKP